MKRKAARLILGLVFLVAGAAKIPHPAEFAQSIANYALITPIAPLLAVVIPWLEATAGLLLIIGYLISSSALILGILSGIFSLAILSALVRGMSIECGCLGNATVSGWHLLVDLGLLSLSFYVFDQGSGTPISDDQAAPETLEIKAKSKAKRKRKKRSN